MGGHPQPHVYWLVNGDIVDEQYEINTGNLIENKLVWPAIKRKDFDAVFTCRAFNTKLTDPKEDSIVLNLLRKWLLDFSLWMNDHNTIFLYSETIDGEYYEYC